MTKEELHLMIAGVVKEVQQQYGDGYVDLELTSVPVDVVPDFDSYRSLVATILLQKKLGDAVKLPKSVFLDKEGKPFSVQNIINYLIPLLTKKKS